MITFTKKNKLNVYYVLISDAANIQYENIFLIKKYIQY